MNVSALSQMTLHWDALLRTLRSAVTTVRTRGSPPLLTAVKACHLVAWLPLHLHRRGVTPLPVVPAAAHKLVLGIQQVLEELWLRGREDVDGAAVLAWAETTGALVGQHEVCAGPASLIVQTCQALLEPSRARPTAVLRAALPLARRVGQQRFLAHAFCLHAVETWRALTGDPRFGASARRALRSPDAGGFMHTARALEPALARRRLQVALNPRMRTVLHAMLDAVPTPGTLPLPAPLRQHLTAEQVFLRALSEGKHVPEGAHLDAWLGQLPRVTAEELLGITLQNTPRGLYLL